jgi:hypothetical protein
MNNNIFKYIITPFLSVDDLYEMTNTSKYYKQTITSEIEKRLRLISDIELENLQMNPYIYQEFQYRIRQNRIEDLCWLTIYNIIRVSTHKGDIDIFKSCWKKLFIVGFWRIDDLHIILNCKLFTYTIHVLDFLKEYPYIDDEYNLMVDRCFYCRNNYTDDDECNMCSRFYFSENVYTIILDVLCRQYFRKQQKIRRTKDLICYILRYYIYPVNKYQIIRVFHMYSDSIQTINDCLNFMEDSNYLALYFDSVQDLFFKS